MVAKLCIALHSEACVLYLQGDVAEADAAGVGDIDTSSSGFCIGTAPVQAWPPTSPSAAAGRVDMLASSAAAGASGKPGLSPRMVPPSRMSMSSPSPRAQVQAASQQQQQQQQLTRPGSPLLQQGQKGQLAATPRAAAAEGAAELLFDRNALYSKYKHSIAEGKRQAEQVKQQQQQVAELKQQIKVRTQTAHWVCEPLTATCGVACSLFEQHCYGST
jgi:hypothetical protein